MSKYINAEYIKALMKNDRLMQGNAEYTLWKQEVERLVDAMPSIDIVHCGECKCCRDELIEEHMPLYIYCEKWNHETDFDGFCKYGERIDNE